MTLDPLSMLAIRHGTDKFGLHDYTPKYHKILGRWRARPLSMLEIGVGGYEDADRGGQSLATWRDYFPKGRITGIDIQRKMLDLGPRVAILQGSQVDAAFLRRVEAERGPFDVILDDGSHRNAHVVESFGLLWPGLAPGGVYLAEDLQTAFFPRFGGSLTLEAPNSVGHFAGFLRDPDALPDLACLERFHNIVALHKAEPGAEAISTARALAGAEAPMARVAAAGLTPEGLSAALDALPDQGILVLDGRPEGALLKDLVALWRDLDHREIAVHFPDHVPHRDAARILGIEARRAGIVLIKGRNDYPSNFRFDITHPQVAEAVAAMQAELLAQPSEAGMVSLATLLTAQHGRAAAADWLDRLAAMGATARGYFNLHGGLLQARKDFAGAEAIWRRALAQFPGDAGFVAGLGATLMAQGQAAEVLDLVETAIAAHPRDVNLRHLAARAALRLDHEETALTHARAALAASPGTRRDKAQLVLAEILAGFGRTEPARAILTELAAGRSRFAERAARDLGRLGAGQSAGAAR